MDHKYDKGNKISNNNGKYKTKLTRIVKKKKKYGSLNESSFLFLT